MVTPFFLPHSVAKPSNHLSYWGTKWLHWRIFSVLVSARAVDTNGIETAGARPAAPAAAPTRFKNPRRVTDDVEISRSDRMFVSSWQSLSRPAIRPLGGTLLQAGAELALTWFLDGGAYVRALPLGSAGALQNRPPVGPAAS